YCLICHHSSKSTLFPYTTLFRSDSIALDTDGNGNIIVSGILSATTNAIAGSDLIIRFSAIIDGTAASRGGIDNVQVLITPEPASDRKSTRLNSSHVKISYAVFCL